MLEFDKPVMNKEMEKLEYSGDNYVGLLHVWPNGNEAPVEAIVISKQISFTVRITIEKNRATENTHKTYHYILDQGVHSYVVSLNFRVTSEANNTLSPNQEKYKLKILNQIKQHMESRGILSLIKND